MDTASYANVRRFLVQGQRPPVDAVRIEEMVNYFPYLISAGPQHTGTGSDLSGPPLAAHLEVATAPWAPDHRLVRIGLKGREVSDAARPAANLVFLLDVSGSMNEPNKLPLMKESLLPVIVGWENCGPTTASQLRSMQARLGTRRCLRLLQRRNKIAEILEAIDRLEAEGSTNGAMGIQLAYDIAKANFIKGGVNRVILATDGDFQCGCEQRRRVGTRLIQGEVPTVAFS